MITVTVVEDDPAAREELLADLESHPDIRVVGAAASLAEARQLVAVHDVCIVDLGLPDGSGLELLADLKARGIKPLVLTVFGDEATAVSALEMGAAGYLLKGLSDVGSQVVEVAAGHAPLTPRIAAHLLRRFRGIEDKEQAATPGLPRLSRREQQTLQMLALGHNYRETAEHLGVSYHTVSDHVKSIYRKLAVNSKASAVMVGLRAGLIRLAHHGTVPKRT